MDTAPTYALSSRTPRWALDPYRFPGLEGLEGLEDAEALGEPAGQPAPAPAGQPQRPSR
ncbi:hypothetical protein [Streptomyces sp. NPDC001389]|uniref:hypothetical protein n=1 Tax=unclassified Streptomyces TaxID=2593676 RepID=UPI0036CB7BA0